MGNVQVEALLEVLRTDGRGQHALFAVDGVDLGTGGVARAGHKLLIAGGGQQLFAVGRGLALGLGVVQEGLVALGVGLDALPVRLGQAVKAGLFVIKKLFGSHSSFSFAKIRITS